MKRRPLNELKELVTLISTLPPGLFLFTKPQMAGVMQISVRCLTDMMRRGEIPYLKLRGSGFVRFRIEDVQRHFTEHALVCNRAAEKEDK